MGLQVSRGVHPEVPTFWDGSATLRGESFWARGYFVSTVGLDEEVVRQYIRRQEQEDHRLEQLNMPWGSRPPLGGC